MILQANFQFNQGSLQDFKECRRRYFLRYIQKLAWPAAESEPVLENERHMQQGIKFHRLVHQHLLGIPGDRLSSLVEKDDLEQNKDLIRWWHNYLSFGPSFDTNVILFPETSMSALLGQHRLVAKFDLITVMPDGSMMVYDWKTARKRPKRDWLKNHMQTHVYQYLLARVAGRFTSGKPVQPDQIQMTYWFAEFPTQPESFSYSEHQFSADELELNQTIDTIGDLARSENENAFPLTSREDRCRYCVYRSLCNRGLRAGSFNLLPDMVGTTVDEDSDFDLDFEQIGELEF